MFFSCVNILNNSNNTSSSPSTRTCPWLGAARWSTHQLKHAGGFFGGRTFGWQQSTVHQEDDISRGKGPDLPLVQLMTEQGTPWLGDWTAFPMTSQKTTWRRRRCHKSTWTLLGPAELLHIPFLAYPWGAWVCHRFADTASIVLASSGSPISQICQHLHGQAVSKTSKEDCQMCAALTLDQVPVHLHPIGDAGYIKSPHFFINVKGN